MQYQDTNTKKCAKCGESKPRTEYYRYKRSADGYQSYCKKCARAAVREWQSSEQGKAYHREYSSKPERRKKQREYSRSERALALSRKRGKKYRQTNKGAKAKGRYKRSPKTKEWRRQYAETDERKSSLRRYNSSKKGRENARRFRAARRARLEGNGGSFTTDEWESLCQQYGHRCLACGHKRKLEADHVVPVSQGGSSFIENIQPLCRSCNARKRADTVDYR